MNPENANTVDSSMEAKHPSHYTEGKANGWETIDVIKNELGFQGYIDYLRGNLIKYVSRLGKKSGTDGAILDAKKITVYAGFLLDATEEFADQQHNRLIDAIGPEVAGATDTEIEEMAEDMLNFLEFLFS